MEILPKEQVNQGTVTDEEVEEYIKEQSSLIRHGGSISFHDLQCLANNFHIDDRIRVRIFQRLEYVNNRQRNWEEWKADKEKQLGRPLTPHEEWQAHQPANITKEDVDKLMAEVAEIKSRNAANRDKIRQQQEQANREYWRKIREQYGK